MARSAGLTGSAVPALEALWERQGGQCPYTGEDLVPGVNASLDHIVSKHRGGGDDPTNLQWVTMLVNSMKTSMTHDEFVETCAAIAARFHR